MRRIKMVLAVAAAMAVMVTAGVAPALANNNDKDRHFDNNCCFHNNNFDNGFLFDRGLGFNDFNNGCFPFCDDFNNVDNSTHGAISGVGDVTIIH